jgi:PIN domain nuclease of toxin-antitoxin system
VSRYLLDTNVALISVSEPERLTRPIRAALLSGYNVLSIVTYWEVMLKSMKGKLDVGDPRTWWSLAHEQLRATSLGLRTEHVSAVYSLPPIHQDPFDRILVAQAKVSGLTLLTTDSTIERYATEELKILA